MNQIELVLCVLVCVCLFGCEQNAAVVVDTPPRAGVASSKAVNPVKSNQQQSQEIEKESTKKQLFDLANKFLDEKSKSGSAGAKKVQELMTEKFEAISDENSQIADDAAKWANDAFQSLRDKGLTSADNAKDWVTEDIRNMNAMKYKVVKISMDDLTAVESQLNKMGELRWDCFHVVESGGDTVLFFKKERRSILKNIPVRDMLKLVPLMNDGGGG